MRRSLYVRGELLIKCQVWFRVADQTTAAHSSKTIINPCTFRSMVLASKGRRTRVPDSIHTESAWTVSPQRLHQKPPDCRQMPMSNSTATKLARPKETATAWFASSPEHFLTQQQKNTFILPCDLFVLRVSFSGRHWFVSFCWSGTCVPLQICALKGVGSNHNNRLLLMMST